MEPYFDRKLRALIHQMHCMVEIDDDCVCKPSVPCHMNGVELGKGFGRKAHDCFMFAACSAGVGKTGCHFKIDDGKEFDKDFRKEIMIYGWRRTFEYLHVAGKIVLPELTPEDFARFNNGAIPPVINGKTTATAYPGTVPNVMWLGYWLEGRAHVA